jgi:sugar lactone lactonase YvrE
MQLPSKFVLALSAIIAGTALLDSAEAQAQPNPYKVVDGAIKLPAGRTWGAVGAVDVDRNGTVWVFERCGGTRCDDSKLDPILAFDRAGNLIKSFGAGMFVFPHGLGLDRDGNVYVTDADGKGGKGHVVVKFSPEGKVLMTLGKPGVAGAGNDEFNRPTDVVVAANGDIFVSDGHGGDSNARVVKYSKDGKFIKTWGKKGFGPGEFDTPHALALDSRGRLFVGDRNNNRIQIFDQDGKFLEEWAQFGRPSGVFIDGNDFIYVADSESNAKRNPGWKRGIRIGSATDGQVTAFIPDPEPEPDKTGTSGAEGVAADAAGNVYGAEVGPKTLRKYVRK